MPRNTFLGTRARVPRNEGVLNGAFCSCAHAVLSRLHARRPGRLAGGLWGESSPFCALFRRGPTAARGVMVTPDALRAVKQFAFINDRVARAKDVLSSYKVELRQVLKEVGKGTWAEYEAKGKEHKYRPLCNPPSACARRAAPSLVALSRPVWPRASVACLPLCVLCCAQKAARSVRPLICPAFHSAPTSTS